MAVIGSALLSPETPTGEIGEEASSFELKFLVHTSSHNDGPLLVLNAPGVPVIGNSYAFGTESHPLARCRTKSAERKQPNSRTWDVTCQFATKDDESENEDENEENEDPESELPEVELDYEEYEAPVERHYDESGQEIADAIRNSCHDKYDPPFTMQEAIQIITVTRNENIATPIASIQRIFQNRTNADLFWGGLPGQARMAGIRARRQFKDNPDKGKIPYLKVTYIIKIHPESWDIEPLDYGPNYCDSMIQKKRRFITQDGQPYLGLLDGFGHPLCGESDNNCDMPAVFLDPKVIYRRAFFAVLGLPQSFLQIA